MMLRDVDDGDLIAQLREHIASDDERVRELLGELELRLYLGTVYRTRSRWVLTALLHEASKAERRDEESHEMLREQLDAAGPG